MQYVVLAEGGSQEEWEQQLSQRKLSAPKLDNQGFLSFVEQMGKYVQENNRFLMGY